MTVQTLFEEAYQTYVKTLLEATASQNIQQRAAEAYSAYSQVLQEMGTTDPYKRAEEAYGNYVRVLQEALGPDDVQKLAEQAYGDYVRALKDAWAKTDESLMDVPSLTAIGQSMLSVAWTASTGTGDSLNSSGSAEANVPKKTTKKS